MKELKDDAVVLRTYKSGESDRVVVLWTRNHGKIRVFAKGIRKPTSKIGGSLEPLSYVKVHLAQSKGDLYIAKNVQLIDQLKTVRGDYDRINAGYGVVEVIDAIPSDDVADEGIFELLTRVLLSLDNPDFYPALIPASFYFKLLAHDGSEPVVEHCVNCEKTGPLVSFDAQMGGTLCATCRSGVSISAEGLALIRRILGGDLAGVLKEQSPAGAGEIMGIAQESIEQHFGKRLKVPRSTPPLSGLKDAR